LRDNAQNELVDFSGAPLASEQSGGRALSVGVLLPDDDVLAKTLTLPVEVEPNLGDAMMLEVANMSPFPSEEVVSGWAILGRHDAQVEVGVALTTKAAVERTLVAFDRSAQDTEVWAALETHRICLAGFAEAGRDSQYLNTLRRLGLRVAGVAAGALCLLALPAWMLDTRADQYQSQLGEVTQRAGAAAASRSQLDDYRDKLDAVIDQQKSRIDYGIWLNVLSQQTPDSVYLNRLEFEEMALEVSGYAVNAAQYQSALAASPAFTEVEATSAFTRDTRLNRERFTLRLQLGDLGASETDPEGGGS
jgi:general secretion pathway protein L